MVERAFWFEWGGIWGTKPTYDAPVGDPEYLLAARQLAWEGPALDGGAAVTVTWRVLVEPGRASQEMVNSALIGHPCGQLTRQAAQRELGRVI